MTITIAGKEYETFKVYLPRMVHGDWPIGHMIQAPRGTNNAIRTVRRVADGPARGMGFARADQLRGLGNMVVPLTGALAFLILLDRAVKD